MGATRAAGLWAGLLCALGLAAPSAGAVDLTGSWHVIAHYKEPGSEHPEREHWEDRLWVFESQDGRLEWTDHPIVVFEDESGRFERLGTNRASRVLGFWEPSPGQLEEIRRGLQYNPRGSKTKTLRGAEGGLWTSSRTSGAGYQSARVLTYEELWQIEGLPDRPVFTRADSLLGGGAEEMEGRTLWETEAVEEDGNLLRGRYDRDGVRVGSFVMRRSGTAGLVRGSGKTQGERVYELFLGEMAGQILSGDLSTVEEAELRRMIETKSVPDDVRAEVRREIRASVEQEMERQGNDPRALRPQVEELTSRIERMYLDEGLSLEEIRKALAATSPPAR
jgi:hypothetical protein